MGENWYTGIFYKVKGTGRVGEQIECPCDDPIILEHTPGVPESRKVYWLKEVEPAQRSEMWEVDKQKQIKLAQAKGTKDTRRKRKGLHRSTFDKFVRIYDYMKRHREPVTSTQLRKAMGFHCSYFMGNPSHINPFSLETLGIVERVPLERNWVAWKLTEKGLREGKEIIESKYEEGQ